MFHYYIHSKAPPHIPHPSQRRILQAHKCSLALKPSCDFETTDASVWDYPQSSVEPTLSAQGDHPPGGNPWKHNGTTVFYMWNKLEVTYDIQNYIKIISNFVNLLKVKDSICCLISFHL